MIDRLRRHFTYANVMATLAVFIALGGSSYAALNITGRDIKDGSLTHRELKRNTLGGTTDQGIATRQGSTRSKRRSPQRLERSDASSCGALATPCRSPMSALRPHRERAAPYQIAAVACEEVNRRTTPGRRLPSHDELMTAIGDYGIALAAGGELTRNVYPSSDAGRVDVLVITDGVGSVTLTPNTAAGAKAVSVRCRSPELASRATSLMFTTARREALDGIADRASSRGR